MTRILCVCLGNICRSPTAEGVLRARLGARAEIDSAGTGDWHVGKPPYGPMQDAAQARGYDLSSLRARQVCTLDCERFDLILAMDEANRRDLEALRPAGNTTPVHLFLEAHESFDEVPDPYFTRDFEEALDLIEWGAADWVARMG